MKSKYIALLAGGLISTLAPAAMSACIYTLTTDAPTYDVGAGTATVKVYLTETLTDGSTSFVNDPNRNGMFSTDFTVSRTSGDAAVISAVTRNAAQFADAMSSVTTSPTSASISNLADFMAASGPMIGVDGRLWLADLTLAAGSGTTPATFAVSVTSPGSSFITFPIPVDLYVLDADPAAQGLAADAFVPLTGTAFQVTVPEPTMLGFAVVSAAMLLRRRH